MVVKSAYFFNDLRYVLSGYAYGYLTVNAALFITIIVLLVYATSHVPNRVCDTRRHFVLIMLQSSSKLTEKINTNQLNLMISQQLPT